ncbi:MAG: toxic anion resistance protein [Lachnospiraceae bacterium]|nr:toxic anion resistance protein [Lachnospiraceae bacterium]
MSITIEKEMERVSGFDIVDTKNELVAKYRGSKEVDELTTQIVLDDEKTIVTFGADVANEIAAASDEVLNSMTISQINDTGKIFGALDKIMKQFDIDELQEDPKGIKKLLGGLQRQIDKIVTKYDTMGKELDKIYQQIYQYDDEIDQSNARLAAMIAANLNSYNKLELLILACEQGLGEIDQLIADTEAKGDNSAQGNYNLQKFKQARILLNQRMQDLMVVEQISMQAIPMLKNMQFNNFNLRRKLDSSFIIALPVFKQAIAQAILIKRQKIQAQASAALDDRVNEMLKKNAEQNARNSADIMRLSSQPSVRIETLQETYNTIVNGIKETIAIQDESEHKMAEYKKQLQQMKIDSAQTLGLPSKDRR